MVQHVSSGTSHSSQSGWGRFGRGAGLLALSSLLVPVLSAQVLTIDTSGRQPTTSGGPVDRQYQQIQPTHVALSGTPMDGRDRLQIVRIMQAEQGFAMRPLPRGHKGLTLEANGDLKPAGVDYLNMVISAGLSAKPGQRVVVTNVKIDRNKLIFDLNGGPDAAHRFLRHISIGTDPYYDNSVVADKGDPGGSRLTLVFKDHVPNLTGDQVKALLAPLISFDVKTPVQAYTDTLPKPLKEAILGHQILVGMNTDMVIFAKGAPETKYHEMEGQMPVDIWLYGKPPQEVTFVRINGNRVIRVEVARTGKPVEVFTEDVVSPMLRGGPVTEQAENVRIVKEGDAQRNPDTQMPAPPPTLRNPGETLPNSDKSAGDMKPVYFPKQQPDDYPDASQHRQQQPDSGSASTPANQSPQAAPQQQAGPRTSSSPTTPADSSSRDDQPN